MTVNSHNPEFGYELLGAVPYAYYLHTEGKLEKTISGVGSEPLYYFSPNHEINPEKRSWENTLRYKKSGIPNAAIHRPNLDTSQFKIPPYREVFANDTYVWDKPTVCICNRYNVEWGYEPINYFSVDFLDTLFTNLKDSYQIVYIGVDLPEHLQDSAHSMPLGDAALLQKFPEVILFQDLLKKSGLSWNDLLLRIFANCKNFITMNGGYSILASFFGGTNIIYCKEGAKELLPNINSFNRWYPNLGNSRVIVARSYDEVLDWVSIDFIEKKPLINVLVRTKKRPIYFRHCMESIKRQAYRNVNVIVGVEEGDVETDRYVLNYPCRVVKYPSAVKDTIQEPPEDSEDYGRFFPYNQYLDFLIRGVPHGWVMFLDDDDMFTRTDSLEFISKYLSEDTFVWWQAYLYGRGVVPKDSLLGKPPVVCNVAGISYCYHISKHKEGLWGLWKKGDFRLAKYLWETCTKKVVIKGVLTNIQRRPGNGLNLDRR